MIILQIIKDGFELVEPGEAILTVNTSHHNSVFQLTNLWEFISYATT